MQNIFLHEFNILFSGKVYLPNVSGMLRAFAETNPDIRARYRFMSFLFERGGPENIAAEWDDPAVLAFSNSLWNSGLNRTLARMAKKRFPGALVVFGGPHVPHEAEEFLRSNPAVDVVVLREGEETFAELLTAFAATRDFSDIKGVAFLHPRSGRYIRTPDRPPSLDLDALPSPYLTGLYDDLLRERGQREYQVILETNRGCPFGCAFCYWGDRVKKVRFFGLERIRQEINWIGVNRIPYVFGADANFGMIPRDIEIAHAFSEGKKQHGYPATFRVCYGKNAENRVFDVARILDRVGLNKGATVSFQSTDPTTLVNIGRGNISVPVYKNLLRRYQAEKIPVYTELILGLPGETYESFLNGLEEIYSAQPYDKLQVGIFLCQVLPNTPIADPGFQNLHGIITASIELVEFHAARRNAGETREYEEVVIATQAMPHEDWKRCLLASFVAQFLQGLKVGFCVAMYLHLRFGIRYTDLFRHVADRGRDSVFPILQNVFREWEEHINNMVLQESPQCVFISEFGDIGWHPEEAAYISIARVLPAFYEEFIALTREFLCEKNADVDEMELREVFLYQEARMPSISEKPREYVFRYTVPEYFDALLDGGQSGGTLKRLDDTFQILSVAPTPYHSREDFARKVIWYGRRDSKVFEPVSWSPMT